MGYTGIELKSKYLIEELNNRDYVVEKQLNGGWIPVSERLPNKEECNKFDFKHPNHRKFLCTIKIKDYEPQVRELYLSHTDDWKFGPESYSKYVTAWQPLPEPYVEGENEYKPSINN